MASTETPIASFSSPNGTAEGNGRQQEEASSKNHPSPVEVEYDSPPPSWFFSRGSSKTSNANKNATNNSNTEGEAKQPAFSANISRSDVSSSSSSAKIDQPFSSQQRISGTSTNYTNADWGMVSDNEDDYEGFNFVAVTKSLVDLSYEQVTESKVVTTNDGNGNEDSGSCQRGVLIVDGLSSINSYEEVVGNANHEASELTIPGSDSLPSEIGSIGHHDYDDRDPLFGTIEGVDPPAENPGHQNRSTGFPEFRPLTSRPSFSRIPSRMHTVSIPRFTTRKKKNCEDEGEDKSESGDTTWSSVKVIEERFVRAPLRLLSKRRLQRRTVSMFLVALLLAALSGRSYVVNQRKQREVWEERLRLEAEARERLQAEKEALRLEMELLQEEAAVATARAESLAMEQERLLIQREEAERERTRLLKEENERLERERQNQQRRRQQPWRSDSEDGEGDFGWSFGDDNENCSGKRGNKDGSTTFTVADNCWIKAKADIDFGSCGDESYNFFGDIWKGLWEDWEYYFDEPNSVATAAATSSAGANWQEEGREGGEQYQDDTYYPPQDPLQDLYSVIHTAGQSLVTKMSDFIADEIESSSRTVQDVEDAVSRRYSETTKTVSEAMEVAKEDMRDLSKEALLVLRAAVKKRSNGNNRGSDKTGAPPPNSNNKSEYGVPREEVSTATKPRAQEVTRQELLDAAAAVATLSKTWQETTKSIFAAEDA